MISMLFDELWAKKSLMEKMSPVKVPPTNKWSWYQAINLPNYVVRVYHSIYEKIRIVGPNFGGQAILPLTMGITMGKEPKKNLLKKSTF